MPGSRDFEYRGPSAADIAHEQEVREEGETVRDLHISVLVRGAVAEAVTEAVAKSSLSEEERQWVRLAIQAEAQSIKLRQAIIEKTLAGLAWSFIVGCGIVIFDYLKAHGWKP